MSTFVLDVFAGNMLIRCYAHAKLQGRYNIGYFPLSCIEDSWEKKGEITKIVMEGKTGKEGKIGNLENTRDLRKEE